MLVDDDDEIEEDKEKVVKPIGTLKKINYKLKEKSVTFKPKVYYWNRYRYNKSVIVIAITL